MEVKKFIRQLEVRQEEHNKKTGRAFNKNSFGKHWRTGTRYLTWVFYRLGLTGNQITVLHLFASFLSIFFIYRENLVGAFVSLLLSQILDSCDGDLARIRNQESSKMAKIDELAHLVSLIVFWFVLFLQTDSHLVVTIIGCIAILKLFEKFASNKLGQQSQFWAIIVKPTDVMVIYLSFIILAAINSTELFILLYAIYFSIGVAAKTVFLLRS